MKNTRIASLAAVCALTAGTGVALALPASADGGGVSKSGGCSMRSSWELKASFTGDGRQDDRGGHRRIEVEFRIDTNRGGQAWNWQIDDNGAVAAQGASHTRRGEDSLEKRRVIANQTGPDTIALDASNAATGETCQGHVVLRGSHS